MSSPLEGSLAIEIGEAFADLFLAATLMREGTATGPAYDPTPGSPTTWTCKAIVDSYSENSRAGGLVKQEDRKILILATSLAVEPDPGDRITISGETFTVIAVETDPAKAVWTCQGRA